MGRNKGGEAKHPKQTSKNCNQNPDPGPSTGKKKKKKRKKSTPDTESEVRTTRQRLDFDIYREITNPTFPSYMMNMTSNGGDPAHMNWGNPQYQHYHDYAAMPLSQPMPGRQLLMDPNVINQRLINIETSLKKIDKLDDIKKSVDRMSLKIDDIDARVKATEGKVAGLEDSMTFHTKQYEDMKKSVEEVQRNLNRSVKPELNGMKTKLSELDKLAEQNSELQERVTDLQCRNMRDNLIFSGIAEDASEDTETVLKGFINEHLKITEDIEFERCHRMGVRQGQRPRAIVAKFSRFKERELVRKAAPKLKDKPYGVNIQYPKEIMEKRKQLLPQLHEAKRQKKKAWLYMDKLYVEGVRVMPNEQGVRLMPNEHGVRLLPNEQSTHQHPPMESLEASAV